jgi:TonB family protein
MKRLLACLLAFSACGYAQAPNPQASPVKSEAVLACEAKATAPAKELDAASNPQNIDILSDTMGVDFGPYLSRVLHDVRLNWYYHIPEAARAPQLKKGKVSIDFAILKNGKVDGMRFTSTAGDASLDRAAWAGIIAADPFPPLPAEFRGNYLALRFHFYYNPGTRAETKAERDKPGAEHAELPCPAQANEAVQPNAAKP